MCCLDVYGSFAGLLVAFLFSSRVQSYMEISGSFVYTFGSK